MPGCKIRKRHGEKLIEKSDRRDVHKVDGLADIFLSSPSMILKQAALMLVVQISGSARFSIQLQNMLATGASKVSS